MHRLLLFPASLRRNSHQRRLIATLATELRVTCEVDILAAAEVGLPLYDQDLEADPAVLSKVKSLHRRFAGVDGIVVASPEYNGHVSPYLKNTIDWVSRLPRIEAAANAFQHKPVLLASASTGWTGGVLGLQDARTIFSYLGCLVAPEQICVSDAERWAADDRFAFDPGFCAFISGVLERFLALVGRLACEGSAPDV